VDTESTAYTGITQSFSCWFRRLRLLKCEPDSNKIYPINIHGTSTDRLRPVRDHDRAGCPVDRRLLGSEDRGKRPAGFQHPVCLLYAGADRADA
jgi:hypothetical protein